MRERYGVPLVNSYYDRFYSPKGELNGKTFVSSFPPSTAYMCQWSRSALVQVMACCPFGTKPLPEPMLAYCQLDSWEQISGRFEPELYHFLWKRLKECIWNCRLPKWQTFFTGGDELKPYLFPTLALYRSSANICNDNSGWQQLPILSLCDIYN